MSLPSSTGRGTTGRSQLEIEPFLYRGLASDPITADASADHRPPSAGTNPAPRIRSCRRSIGIFRYVRHPMYASLLLLTWGVFLKNVSLAGFLLSVTASTFLVATAYVEEREDVMRFGEAYSACRRRTRRFIPFIY